MDKLNYILNFEYIIKPLWLIFLLYIIYFVFRKNIKTKLLNIFSVGNKKEEKDSNTESYLYLLLEFSFFTILVIATWTLMLVDKNVNNIGDWGDFFGGVLNPILTFITFMGLLITILLQQKELKLSREELQLSREELNKSANALTKQEKNLQIQNFENRFFHMIELHNSIVDSLNFQFYKSRSNNYIVLQEALASRQEFDFLSLKGRHVFQNISKYVRQSYDDNILNRNHDSIYKFKDVKNNYNLGAYYSHISSIPA